MPIRGDRLRWPPRPGKRSNAVRSNSEPRADAATNDDGASKPESSDDAARDTGTRQTRSTDEETPAPRQPNERDTSSDSQAGAPSSVMRRAHDDVTGGQMDTDCRNSAVEVVERNESKRRRTP
jgi:hypothetical protein